MDDEMVLPSAQAEGLTGRQRLAMIAVGMSLLLGVVGNAFFYHNTPGINIPLYVSLFLAAAVGLLAYAEKPMMTVNTLFTLPSVFFALMLSFHTSSLLVAINAVLLAGALFLYVSFGTGRRFLGGNLQGILLAGLEGWLVDWLEGPLTLMVESAKGVRRLRVEGENLKTLGAVLRGLLLALPILIVFGVLLASADVVFGDLVEGLFSWVEIENWSSLISQLLIIAAFTWVCMMAFKLLVFGALIERFRTREASEPAAQTQTGFRLGMIEAGIVLGSVDVLFLMFVIIQARYLFGGEANITAQGYTYSEYARRGFFELLAVSLMTMGLVILLQAFTRRSSRQRENLFRALTLGMIGLTFVILVAAFQRLNLYEEAYGFTRLRVMTQVFMVWLALLFGVLILELLGWRFFWKACVLMGIGFAATLNLMNLDAFIAAHNIARFDDTGKLDVSYLLKLSNDAVPEIAPLLDHAQITSAERGLLLEDLGARLYELDNDRDSRRGLGYHFGKAEAWEALDRYRGILAPFIKPRDRFYGF